MSDEFRGDTKASAKSVTGALRRQRVTLTAAQIKALFTTPISLVSAPGAGKYISVDEIMAFNKFNTTAFTGANALEIRYTDGSGVKATGDLASAFINAAASRVDKAVAAAVTSVVANAALVVAVPTANPAAGDGTITFDICYRICSLS